MKKALQSTEVVQSLFPETVRDRLFEEASTMGNKKGTFDARDAGDTNKAYDHPIVAGRSVEIRL